VSQIRRCSKPLHPSLHAPEVLQIGFHNVSSDAYVNSFMNSAHDKDIDPPNFEASSKRIEPKRAENVHLFLAEEEPARLAAIVESSDDAIISKTLEGVITSWNEGAQRIYGYSAEEAIGRPISMLVPPEHPDEVPGILEKIRRGEKVEHYKTVRVTKDGRRLDISLTVSPIKDAQDNVVGGSAIARDITEREEAERRLREAETLYRTLVEQIPAITYIQEPLESNNPKAVTYMSPQYETILGYPAESEVIDEEHWLRTLHPEDRERVLAEEIRTDETGEPFEVEYRVIAQDGRTVWLRDQARLVRDQEEGRPLYWLGVQLDITEQKRIEEELRQSEQLHRAVVEQAAEGILLVDVDTKRILEANTAYQNLLGYTPEEIMRLMLYDIVPYSREDMDCYVERVLKQRSYVSGERRHQRRDGSLVDVEVSANVVSYSGREAMCIVVRDITERKRAKEALREVEKAERLRMARDLHDGVLQDLSYSAAAMQFTRLNAEGTGLEEELQKQINAIQGAVQGLRAAVNDLRLEEERDRPFPELIESLVQRNRAMARGYEIGLKMKEGLPKTSLGNTGTEVLRVIQEALTNARRHSGARSVRVMLRPEQDSLLIEISDDGRGFEPETTPGVGLKSMRERAAALGSKLEVTSGVGQGTRVSLRVPILQRG
jgi:PAS domain S-box-containing protein